MDGDICLYKMVQNFGHVSTEELKYARLKALSTRRLARYKTR
jgi:hypothetical protein